MYALYSDVPDYHFLFDRVRTDMTANNKVIEKNRKILANLRAQMDGVDMDFTIVLDLWKEREIKRKKFIHYNAKLAKLRQSEAER